MLRKHCWVNKETAEPPPCLRTLNLKPLTIRPDGKILSWHRVCRNHIGSSMTLTAGRGGTFFTLESSWLRVLGWKRGGALRNSPEHFGILFSDQNYPQCTGIKSRSSIPPPSPQSGVIHSTGLRSKADVQAMSQYAHFIRDFFPGAPTPTPVTHAHIPCLAAGF